MLSGFFLNKRNYRSAWTTATTTTKNENKKSISKRFVRSSAFVRYALHHPITATNQIFPFSTVRFCCFASRIFLLSLIRFFWIYIKSTANCHMKMLRKVEGVSNLSKIRSMKGIITFFLPDPIPFHPLAHIFWYFSV